MSPTDRDALERCIVAARIESSSRRLQLDAMLADESREAVGIFACGCAQTASLRLDPWQVPVFRANLDDLNRPYGDASGKRELAELLRRLLDAGLSRFEPDPVSALAAVEQRQAAR